ASGPSTSIMEIASLVRNTNPSGPSKIIGEANASRMKVGSHVSVGDRASAPNVTIADSSLLNLSIGGLQFEFEGPNCLAGCDNDCRRSVAFTVNETRGMEGSIDNQGQFR